MIRSLVYVVAFFAGFALTLEASGAESARSYNITISGRREALVTTARITLGDIAVVAARDVKDHEAQIALQKISVADAPVPGTTVTLSAAQILASLQAAGADLSKVGYTLPRVVVVRRASRSVGVSEVRALIEEQIRRSGRDVALKDVTFPNDVQIAPDMTLVEVRPFNESSPGRMEFTVVARSEQSGEIRFNARAAIDEWKQVPVARRGLSRGSVVSSDDMMMARLNTAAIPRDSEASEERILGLELKAEVFSGETFRREKLVKPAIVTSGQPVTMVFRAGPLEATARGVALQNGADGDDIRVRNEASKKVVTGKVTKEGLIEVRQ